MATLCRVLALCGLQAIASAALAQSCTFQSQDFLVTCQCPSGFAVLATVQESVSGHGMAQSNMKHNCPPPDATCTATWGEAVSCTQAAFRSGKVQDVLAKLAKESPIFIASCDGGLEAYVPTRQERSPVDASIPITFDFPKDSGSDHAGRNSAAVIRTDW